MGITAVPITNGNGQPTHWSSVFRVWSDGTTDYSRFITGGGCEPVLEGGPSIVLPGSCMADVDRNGFVETPDLLELLAGWGPCEEGAQ